LPPGSTDALRNWPDGGRDILRRPRRAIERPAHGFGYTLGSKRKARSHHLLFTQEGPLQIFRLGYDDHAAHAEIPSRLVRDFKAAPSIR
jgi:hypothetical protein